MKLKRSKPAETVVGLDLDPGYVAAAEVEVNGRISVRRSAIAPLHPGVLRDGEVADPAALSQALSDLWAESGLGRQVRLGLANQRIVVRTLDLPPLEDPKAIASAVRVEAPDHIPMPMDEAILDHQVIGLVDTPAGKRTRAVVVAVRRQMVERYVEAVRAAGLRIAGIDLSAFALLRALSTPEEDGDGGVLYVQVSGLVNVAVASGGHCLFTRAAAGGLDTMVHALADRRGLTVEHATQWLKHVGLETPVAEVDGDPEIVAAARTVLEDGVHQLADTVRNSLNFYRMQENAELVQRGVLTGPAVGITGFAEHLGTSLGMPVETRLVPALDEEAGDVSRLAVAAGLSVESVGLPRR